MPARSSHTAVVTWPDRVAVDAAVRAWADALAAHAPEVEAIGYFGSYARGDWGVGSDVDLVVVVGDTPLPFERRAARWDATRLPVPADVLVYTHDEWAAHPGRPRDVVWVVRRKT